jgi:flagellar biosynthesis protein FlhA
MSARSVGAAFLEFGRLGLAVPLMLLLIVGMMVVPMPPAALDFLFTLNMALALVVILAVVYVRRPLDIAVFPTVLLGATLMRLALNVASTRVVLLHGHEGPAAAGHVIESFGEFVVGGNYAVGLIVFIILVIINFVVVTKGAGRVSEVSARFTLDAMPGKQMAIDADLNAGIISSQEAQARRSEIREEADFYGSMDGASKFVRGDAVAGVLIVVINLVAGLGIGTLQHGLPFADAGRIYSLLTIGDGLVAQIPALLLSVATAVLVTRMSRSTDIGKAVASQVLAHPRALGITAGILAAMGLIPGMPNVVFLMIAGVLGGTAWLLSRSSARAHAAVPGTAAEAPPPAPKDAVELTWDEVESVDQVGLEVGYRLIPLVDRAQGGELMARIKGVRKKLSEDLGFLVPPVHIRDNLDLPPGGYRITIMGVTAGEAEAHADRDLAIDSGQVSGPVAGSACKDPAFGLPAVWIDRSRREHAQSLGYTVVDSATVIATHLSQLLNQNAHELLGHEEVQQLLERLKRTAPRLVEELVPKALPMSLLVRVLQNLLAERVPIRNLRVIGETLAEQAPRTQDAQALTGAVRVALGRSIVQDVAGMNQDLSVMTLDSRLEDVLLQAVQGGEAGGGFEPGLADRLFKALTEGARRQQRAGEPTVLLVSPKLRSWIARLTRHALPGMTVLAYNEVPENRRINVVAAIGRTA